MTSRSADRLARAERRAQAARSRLGATLDEIQTMLSPANLMNEAVQELRSRGHDIAGQAASKLMSKPIVTTVAASAVGLLLKRKPALALLLKFILPKPATSRRAKHSTRKAKHAPLWGGRATPQAEEKETA